MKVKNTGVNQSVVNQSVVNKDEAIVEAEKLILWMSRWTGVSLKTKEANRWLKKFGSYKKSGSTCLNK